MSAVGAVGIGLAWAIMAMAAFAALSASALARTRRELEMDPRGANTEGLAAQTHSQGLHSESLSGRAPVSTHAYASTHAHAGWSAIEMAPASPALRSSPSVAYMQAATGHVGPGPIHLR